MIYVLVCSILCWYEFNKLKITNSFYRHKDIHKYTWEARGTKSVIDYIIINVEYIKSKIK